ncbi:MAG TPA: winged helix-turn-helix domain-containing protein [Candidatus Cloacimonadota bacterium]|nr:winged helix-turn-helix domain-containing protein [Candidatus Cloacimonadota bacterium]
MNNQLYNSKTLQLYNSFARVKGSGTFHLDEFCAVTGMDPRRAIRCLIKAERLGAILRLGELFLLYPPKPDNRKVWHDWKFDIAKQRMIYDACYVKQANRNMNCRRFNKSLQDGVTQAELLTRLSISKTTLGRYMGAMEKAGILLSERYGNYKIYRQGTWRPLTTYREEKANVEVACSRLNVEAACSRLNVDAACSRLNVEVACSRLSNNCVQHSSTHN